MRNTLKGAVLLIWVRLAGTGFSQLLNVLARLPLMMLGDVAPDPDETLSAVIGRRAAEGAVWALVAQWIVDRIMAPLEGWKLGHSARAAAAHAASKAAPKPSEQAPTQ